MEREPQPDGQGPEETTESILEALLVDDAEVVWDPVTGNPRVERRPKATLDSPPRTP